MADERADLHPRTDAGPGWPRLGRIPDGAETAELAWRLRTSHAGERGYLSDLDGLCRRAGCDVSVERLRAAEGGLRGLLIPSRPGHFRLVVDGDPPGGVGGVPVHLRAALSRHRRRFVIAHELAHTFFFSWRGGRAHLRLPRGEAQEEFCDEFARALLVPPRLAARYDPTPESVIEIQNRFDVSMEVAARALAAANAHGVFVAVLLRHSDHPDLTRPQWRTPDAAPAGRWWTGELVASALQHRRARGELDWLGAGRRAAQALFVPRRHQVLLTATRPRQAR